MVFCDLRITLINIRKHEIDWMSIYNIMHFIELKVTSPPCWNCFNLIWPNTYLPLLELLGDDCKEVN
jgi:hypothetical protein